MNKRKEAVVFLLVLIVLFSFYFYLKPAVTGYFFVAKSFNYSDEVNLVVNENYEYEWALANYGELKSIRLNGRIEGKGFARVYVENDDVRHLIFDSDKLKEGLGIITALAILNVSEMGNISDDTKNASHFPSNKLFHNLSTTKNLQSKFLSETIEINESIINITQPLNQTLNETKIIINESINKTINMSETNVSEHIQNLTVLNKSIRINLEYKTGTDYDIDDNGIETTTGVVDLTVENSLFKKNEAEEWQPDESKLCTRWEIYSVEDDGAVTVCYGNEQCCSFIELSSSSSSWDDVFYSYYGLYEGGLDNVVSAQVVYVDYNLSFDELSAEIYYSSWQNLSVRFYHEAVIFEDTCIETCLLTGFNKTSYKLIFEVSNASIAVDSIEYTTSVKEEVNNPPVLIKNISSIVINKNQEHAIDLNEYFFDEEELSYRHYKAENLSVVIEDGNAVIIPDHDFAGERFMFFTANDSSLVAVSNVFSINVLAGEFIIKNSLGEKIASVDQNGNMFVKGVEENQLVLIPADDSFIIENKAGVVAYINNSGYLFLKGGLFEKEVMEAAGDNFEIKAGDDLAAFFDDDGNLKLKGEMFENTGFTKNQEVRR